MKKSTKTLPIFTKKTSYATKKLDSYQIMVDSGIIKKFSSGIYYWMPYGLKILRNLKKIIRKEINSIGGLEILAPLVQKANIWEKTNRLVKYGKELAKFTNRENKLFVISPTNEEAFTLLAREMIKSYKDMPMILYQIQTKFRDEIRSRFGLIRSKEFIMKDAYSFHTNVKCLEKTYKKFFESYKNIFSILNLRTVSVKAESGIIGGNKSHEFYVFSKKGESSIIKFKKKYYSKSFFIKKVLSSKKTKKSLQTISTKEVLSIENFSKKFSIPLKKILKFNFFTYRKNNNAKIVGIGLRGDTEISLSKLKKVFQCSKDAKIMKDEEIEKLFRIPVQFVGPINLSIPFFIDYKAFLMKDFVSGSNSFGKYLSGINWKIDTCIPQVEDLKKEVEKENSNETNFFIKKGIEIGHIFQIGTKYSKFLNAFYTDKFSKKFPIFMGCYGIGITRLVSVIVEKNYDSKGIIWPKKVCPYKFAILPTKMSKKIENFSKKVYSILKNKKIKVLFDNRNKYFGEKYADLDLIGIPKIIIVSDRLIKYEQIELNDRIKKEKIILKLEEMESFFI
ncbi:proline--tRNA ligase [bacterium endosymbiont of Pedicinus badii]|uniref:proline--tRNA ligase n=1 Tax=bacterium endosymbiont of Pedicinus badii TaxID=1719126 RepID=UPI0009BBAFDD|nr:proline--tRNA ligase [bacterium endosymbiont of Pedicinus badii]OQM33985.1 hypothetical protein AOQ89_01320 [bacterium endosymbiont of Pedicinus badii]